MAVRFVPDPNIVVSTAVKPDGIAAEVVQAALEGVIRFVVCPELLEECRSVLLRDRFRRYITEDQAGVLVDSIEAASDLVADPAVVERVSADADDDYLLALATRESVVGVISGDSDLVTDTGPRVLTPREVLDLLLLTAQQRRLLVMALWNLDLRLKEVAGSDLRLAMYRTVLRSAAAKTGGNPDIPLFDAPRLDATATDVRSLSREERSIAAFALELDRRTTGSLHGEHARQVRELLAAFQITDTYADLERLVGPL